MRGEPFRTARAQRRRRPLTFASAGLLVLVGASCDTGDGRELREPSVPYVAPTDPPATSAP